MQNYRTLTAASYEKELIEGQEDMTQEMNQPEEGQNMKVVESQITHESIVESESLTTHQHL